MYNLQYSFNNNEKCMYMKMYLLERNMHIM